ncbi:LysM peptidoglycan-binding domain-containing protein [Jiangella rhizosphaerae]|uniref:LysM peptidoglycan-binding domain-containing protein n=1 Tax=Jiangella rhizosphaerae TaxID=2293569 RepID=A0A418KTF3_9ACTN|nr:LysM peptidoglycan-binding domain-containing protein [Jiangella rhizosphaerae]RIQ30060.1 LysM peptidoglycan-binding domain-containing protein [Jiangella rhizosphaerae]
MATTTTYIPPFESRTRVVIEPERTDVPRRHVARRRPAGRPTPVPCVGSAEPSLHGARLTRRGRVVVGFAWLMLIVAGALAFVRPWEAPAGSGGATAVTTVEVRGGDTLWELATDAAPTADPRETVAAIMELNGLSSASDIRPGDLIQIPSGR